MSPPLPSVQPKLGCPEFASSQHPSSHPISPTLHPSGAGVLSHPGKQRSPGRCQCLPLLPVPVPAGCRLAEPVGWLLGSGGAVLPGNVMPAPPSLPSTAAGSSGLPPRSDSGKATRLSPPCHQVPWGGIGGPGDGTPLGFLPSRLDGVGQHGQHHPCRDMATSQDIPGNTPVPCQQRWSGDVSSALF